MTTDPCTEMHLLIQADTDGELAAADAARIAAHIASCPACAELHAQLAGLSQRLRAGVPYWPAPDALRTAVRQRIASRPPVPLAGTHAPPVRQGILAGWRLRLAAPFGAGFALAAGLALAVLVPQHGGVSDALVAGHIRALQPGHLMDVVSTDQHTVKPWFDGRLDFAPPVRDLKPDGFPLMGARLDYVADRPVAVLVYGRRQHVIDLFVWPESSAPRTDAFGHSGYNVLRWHRDGMVFWAVSDLGAPELAEFARLWTAGRHSADSRE